MAKHGEAGHFVTVLPISEKGTSHAQIRSHSGIPLPKRPASAPNVTVLEVKNTAEPFTGIMATEVLDHATIYRLPGERLGMALKFVGGTNAGDTVSKVFIQSINPESPASRAQSKFAPIREGDEILKIGERDVTSMTRLDCVTLLRDSPVCINLIIRHMSGFIQLPAESNPPPDASRTKREPPPIPPRKASTESPPVLVKSPSTKSLDRIGNGSIVRPSIPPPLPPRKISKDDSTNQSAFTETRSQSVPPPPPPRKDELKISQQSEVDSARTVLQRTRSAPSSEERPRFMRPAEAEAYTDLFADDDDNYVDESDDTASSVSTVIDRLHSRSSTANSSFSEHAYGYDRPPIPRFELEKAMHPLMEMERKIPEVPPRPSVHKLPLEDIELSETPDPQPAAEIFEKLQENGAERPVEMPKNVPRKASETEDPKCQIIAAKCQSPSLNEDSSRSRKIVVDAPVLLDKPDLEPIVQDDSSSSSSEDDLAGMERCSPSGDSFNSSSSSADSVVDASSPVPCSPTLADRKRTQKGAISAVEPLQDAKQSSYPHRHIEKESVAANGSDDLQPEKFAVSSDVDSGVQEEHSTLVESAELFQTAEADLGTAQGPEINQRCSQQDPGEEQEASGVLAATVPASQSPGIKSEDETEKMMTLNYSSGRLPPDGREFPSNFDEPKAWKEVFRGHKSLSVDDSGVFCSTPSSDESHSPTQKSPSPAFSSENLLLSNQYTSPINGDRRGSMSSVYSKFREASQRRYSGLLMSMLEPNSSEPKSKLKGLVLSKSDAPASTAAKVLPVIVTNPVVVKVDSTPVLCQKAQTTDSPRALPLGAAATFRKSLGLGDVSDWDTPSRPAPPLPGPASEDVPDAPPKGDLIERYLNSYQDQENEEKLRSNRSGSCANIATIKDAELFARSSIGETRSKWQSMEFQTPPQGPPPIPPRPASRQTENSRSAFTSTLKSAKSEASLNIISPSNGMTETEVVPGPQNFRALAAKWEQRSSRDTAPPIPARKSSDPRIVVPKPATRSSVPNLVPTIPPNYPPPVRPAPRGTSDVKKTFEEVQRPIRTVEHKRFSSVDSDDSGNSSTSTTREQYSSLTSLASTSSSLISPQDLQQLIDEANQSLQDEEGVRGENIDVYVVVLHKDSPTSGAGITLAGGCDYENKEITVHKVITGSAADRDGRIRRGDRVLSINGKTLKATTHREALEILKSPRSELVLVLSRDTSGRSSSGARSSLSRASSISSVLDVIDEPANDGPLPTFEGSTVIVLEKDKVGLGFTLQGGKDSPLGNKPLTINRIFSCGAAERDGRLQPGDELLAINNTVTTNMSRTEAWNFLKKLSEGKISFTIRQQCR